MNPIHIAYSFKKTRFRLRITTCVELFCLGHWLKISLDNFLFCLGDFCSFGKPNCLGERLGNLLHYATTFPEENKLHRKIQCSAISQRFNFIITQQN